MFGIIYLLSKYIWGLAKLFLSFGSAGYAVCPALFNINWIIPRVVQRIEKNVCNFVCKQNKLQKEVVVKYFLPLCFCIVFICLLIQTSFAEDLIVNDVKVIENQKMTIEGSIVVKDGGNLTFKNSTVIIKNSFDGEYGIFAEPGSSLAIYNSDLKPISLESRFTINIKDAKFVMMNTHLSGVGYGHKPAIELDRLNNAIIKENSITNMKSIAFRLNNVTNTEIANNSIVAKEEQREWFPAAIDLNLSKDNNIVDNYFTDIDTGITMHSECTGNYVAGNKLTPGITKHLSNGIYVFWNSDNNVFENNEIHGPTG